jgi:hypothetical protein
MPVLETPPNGNKRCPACSTAHDPAKVAVLPQFPQFPAPAAEGRPQVHPMMGGRPWMAPSVTMLPMLTALLQQTGDPIDGTGGTGGGGSSVF